jgi:hypothetical protein
VRHVVIVAGLGRTIPMLSEDQVVDAVCDNLRADGWKIVSIAHATEHGDDVVAERDGQRLIVEAKGEGSSKEGTRRFGQSFNRGQVRTHVAVAVLRALGVVSEGKAWAGVAFPDNRNHREIVGKAARALAGAGVGVYWVDPSGVVTEATCTWDVDAS